MGIFKAYDIRGRVPSELNEALARRIGQAFASLIGGRTLVVGRDMRSHSPAIQAAVIEGIRDSGSDVIDIGLASTPMAYFAIGSLPCEGGLNVTASHNGPEWNGFKLCRPGARPVSYDTGIGAIEARATATVAPPPVPKRGEVRKEEMLARYVDHVMRFAGALEKRRLLVDAANGMAGLVLPPLAERLRKQGVDLEPLFWELDGRFPNHEANPLKPEVLAVVGNGVKKGGFHAGASFDGDADRCAFVDENGEPVPNDLLTALLARELLQRHPGAAIVYDLRSSWIVPETIAAAGGRPIRERVGHSFIKETMRREQAIFGGELSGHYYWKEHFYSDSAMVAFVEVLTILSASAEPFSERVRDLRKYSATGEINFEVEDKEKAMSDLRKRFQREATRVDELDGITIELGSVEKRPWWWFNVRPSNTEPLLRLNLEASDPALRDEKRDLLVKLLGTPVH